MSKVSFQRILLIMPALFLAASCGNGPGAEDAGDEDADADPIEADVDVPGDGVPEGVDVDIDGEAPGDGEMDAPDLEADGEISECGGGAVDGDVCGEEPRRICLDGACVESACGDGFADAGAGEECDDGGNGDPDDGCTDACAFSCHENADCEDGSPCAIGVCDTAASHACDHTAGPIGTLCRPSAGVCDVEESCDGLGLACPGDAFLPLTIECRASGGQCDPAESCTGTSASCPVDSLEPPGTPCDDGISCTLDACDGFGACVGTPSTLLFGVSAIDAGYYFNCAAIGAGGVKCWGANAYGQLGDGTTTQRNTPVVVSGLSSIVPALAAGEWHACALLSTGGVKCWGRNNYGQLGDGTTTDRFTPADVSGLTSGVSAIVAGNSHTCVLMSTGGMKCWGYAGPGALGDGSAINRLTPVDVTGLTSGVSAMAAGGYHTCAVTSTGGVKCWGENNNGQLGDGTQTDRTTAVDVSGLSTGISAITGGYAHTCVLTGTGGVKCWGGNPSGQLGDGTTTQRLTSVDVSGLAAGVSAIGAGGSHTCALMSTGGLRCWGLNVSGQIGDGTTTGRLTPVDVSGLTSGVFAISPGYFHTCALMAAGGVKCWGHGGYGQLGDGMAFRSLVPVDVLCE